MRDHILGDVTAERLAGGEVEPKMHPGNNAAERRLVCRRRKACERALHLREDFGADGEAAVITVKEERQHRRSGRAVPVSGVQVGSAIVSGLSSVSAARIAVTGRQNW